MADAPPTTDPRTDQRPDQRPAGKRVESGPVTVKKYANRRLYNTETSSYVTLEDLAAMVRLGRDFAVSDAKTGEDITRSVLTQIIVEEESKGTNLLPIPFLRQLIGLYGDSLQSVVPRYLEATMGHFARQQEGMRRSMQTALGAGLGAGMGGAMVPFGGGLTAFEEMGKQNLAMLERAISLFSPFPTRTGTEAATDKAPEKASDRPDELDAMREEIAALRHELAEMRARDPGKDDAT